MPRAVVGPVLVAALLLAGCGGLLPTPDLTQPSPVGPEPDIDVGVSIDVANSTALAVSIVVNGSLVGVIPPNTNGIVKPGFLPPKPWVVEGRTASGRLLLTFSVASGQISRTTNADGTTTISGAGVRRDLSCGRLDVSVGGPMLGPAAGPGAPGDCVP